MVGRGCAGLPALGGDGFEDAGAADGEAVATEDIFCVDAIDDEWRDVFTGGRLLIDWLTPRMVDSAFPFDRGGG